MTLIFRLIIRRDIWIFHSKVFSSDQGSLIPIFLADNLGVVWSMHLDFLNTQFSDIKKGYLQHLLSECES